MALVLPEPVPSLAPGWEQGPALQVQMKVQTKPKVQTAKVPSSRLAPVPLLPELVVTPLPGALPEPGSVQTGVDWAPDTGLWEPDNDAGNCIPAGIR